MCRKVGEYLENCSMAFDFALKINFNERLDSSKAPWVDHKVLEVAGRALVLNLTTQ